MTSLAGGVTRIHVPAHIRCPLPMVKGVRRGSWSRLEVGWVCDFVGLGVPPRILLTCHDEAARFVQLLMVPGSEGLVQEDFVPLLQVRGNRGTDVWTGGHVDRQTGRHTVTQARTDMHIRTDGHADRQAQKWKDTQTDPQKERFARGHRQRDTRTDGHAG